MRSSKFVAQAMADATNSAAKKPYADRVVESLRDQDVFVVDIPTMRDVLVVAGLSPESTQRFIELMRDTFG